MQCADCASELDDALILVCDHNLCLSCAAKKSSGSSSIRCRVCQSVTNLEQSSAAQLKEMFPHFSRPPLPPPSTSCGQCETSRADLRCLQCEEILCFDCSETLHRRGKLATHQIVPLNNNSQNWPQNSQQSSNHNSHQNSPQLGSLGMSQIGALGMSQIGALGMSQIGALGMSQHHIGSNSPMSGRSVFGPDRSVITMRSVGCHSHPDEPIQYFCLRCETRPMCSECVFRSGEHSNHLNDVVLVKKAFPKIKSRMNELIVSFEKSIKENRYLELNLFENKKSVETIGSNSKIQIEKYFSDLHHLLKDREADMISQVSATVDTEVVEIEKEAKKCAIKREKMESVSKILQEVSMFGAPDGGSITEREIEVLESFSEMKSVISETRNEKNSFKLVQLYIPSDSVALMDKQVNKIKSDISSLCNIVPSRNVPSPESTASLMSTTSSRKKRVKGTTSGDMLLINAIDDAIRSG